MVYCFFHSKKLVCLLFSFRSTSFLKSFHRLNSTSVWSSQTFKWGASSFIVIVCFSLNLQHRPSSPMSSFVLKVLMLLLRSLSAAVQWSLSELLMPACWPLSQNSDKIRQRESWTCCRCLVRRKHEETAKPKKILSVRLLLQCPATAPRNLSTTMRLNCCFVYCWVIPELSKFSFGVEGESERKR